MTLKERQPAPGGSPWSWPRRKSRAAPRGDNLSHGRHRALGGILRRAFRILGLDPGHDHGQVTTRPDESGSNLSAKPTSRKTKSSRLSETISGHRQIHPQEIGLSMRPSQRQPDELRPLRLTRRFTCHAEGSVLIEMGETGAVHRECRRIGPLISARQEGSGWVTAEYGMPPVRPYLESARSGWGQTEGGLGKFSA